MAKKLSTREARMRRHKRIRATLIGSAAVPRLAVYRSNSSMYAQIIDDAAGKTLVAASARELAAKGTKRDMSAAVGTEIAVRAQAKKIKKVVFDRGGFLYAGRVKALADAARAGGLEF